MPARNHKRLLTLATVAAVVTLTAVAAPERARLVVGIVVKDLDYGYLELLRDRFGGGGFKRLMSEGVIISDADYGTSLDPVAATALIMSGTSPRANGIPAAEIYDPDRFRATAVLSDGDYIGNYTDETFSPRALCVSTLADEVRIAADGLSAVYGVAADAQQAIILSGHAANAALWLNDKTGNWASTTYYKDIPQALSLRNRLSPLSARLDTMSWTPLLNGDLYPDLPDHLRHYPFRYTFPRNKAERYSLFTQSPLSNTEVTAVATELLATLGNHDGTDMLNVAYNLSPYPYAKTADNRFELMDAYLRLDRDIAKLLAAADKAAGRDRTVIFVAGTPPERRQRKDDDRFGIPYGEFSAKKAISLLNLYLIAVYGNGEWVKGYHDRHFYLNTTLAKGRNIDIHALRSEAADFLKRMSGVKSAYSADEILTGTAGEKGPALRRNTVISATGDVLVDVLPGWEIVDDHNSAASPDRTRMVERSAATTAPVFIIAPGLLPQTLPQSVDARAIARTISGILRIRAPNAADTPAISLTKARE